MWQRFTLYDLRVVGHYLGTLTMFWGIAMLIPFATAVMMREWEPAARYFFAAGLAFSCGALLRFLRIEPGRLSRQQALGVTGMAWVVLAIFSAVPLYFSGHYEAPLDAMFDAVSGLTTTGAAVIIDLDHLSSADNMFRFMMHLLGGLGLIVVALSIGLFGKRSGAALYTSEGRREHVVPNVIQTTQFIARVTAVIVLTATAILTILCVANGIEPVRAFLHALWLSISGFLTSGFTPMGLSVAYYHSFAIEVVLMVLMLLGSVSFMIFFEVWRGRIGVFLRDIETRTVVIWLGVMTLVFASALSTSPLFSDLPAMLRRGLFMVISSHTTTGFQTVTSNQITTVFTSGAFLTLALIMAVGGGAGSTAGGIKLYRVGIIFKAIVSTVKEALSPDSARVVVAYNRNGRHILTPDVVQEAMTVFILYVVTYVVGALVGVAHGYDATQAIFESVAMTSNGGITTGLAAPGMPPSLELFYILQMWAGRLEFVTLLALIVKVGATAVPRKRRTSR